MQLNERCNTDWTGTRFLEIYTSWQINTGNPQALILACDNAWRIGRAIVEYGKNIYLRARAATLEAGRIIKEAVEAKKLV
jgi:hypothetical protein